MNPKLRIPATLIDRATAEAYPDATQLALDWTDCGDHLVADCRPCATTWQFDQLAHTSIGYYPGERRDTQRAFERASCAAAAGEPPHGNRYAHRCPVCHNDLTPAVQLHLEACRLRRANGGTLPSPTTP